MSDSVSLTIWERIDTLIPTIFTGVVMLGGSVFTLGRMKEKMLTKKSFADLCAKSQTKCSVGVVGSINELKTLVIQLHDKQTAKIEEIDAKQSKAIEAMDDKREKAKDFNHVEIQKITQAIGRLEGKMLLILGTNGD